MSGRTNYFKSKPLKYIKKTNMYTKFYEAHQGLIEVLSTKKSLIIR